MKWLNKMLQKIHIVFGIQIWNEKYGKYWIIFLGHFMKHKPHISSEWIVDIFLTLFTGENLYTKYLLLFENTSFRIETLF